MSWTPTSVPPNGSPETPPTAAAGSVHRQRPPSGLHAGVSTVQFDDVAVADVQPVTERLEVGVSLLSELSCGRETDRAGLERLRNLLESFDPLLDVEVLLGHTSG